MMPLNTNLYNLKYKLFQSQNNLMYRVFIKYNEDNFINIYK